MRCLGVGHGVASISGSVSGSGRGWAPRPGKSPGRGSAKWARPPGPQRRSSKLGPVGAVGDGAGGLVPPGGLVGVGLPVSGAVAVGVPGLVGFAGKLVQVPGLGLDELAASIASSGVMAPPPAPARAAAGSGRRRAGQMGGVAVVKVRMVRVVVHERLEVGALAGDVGVVRFGLLDLGAEGGRVRHRADSAGQVAGHRGVRSGSALTRSAHAGDVGGGLAVCRRCGPRRQSRSASRPGDPTAATHRRRHPACCGGEDRSRPGLRFRKCGRGPRRGPRLGGPGGFELVDQRHDIGSDLVVNVGGRAGRGYHADLAAGRAGPRCRHLRPGAGRAGRFSGAWDRPNMSSSSPRSCWLARSHPARVRASDAVSCPDW